MTEQLVTFETAVLARRKGFDEICRNMWMENDIVAVEINAPKDEEITGGFLTMFLKYSNDPEQFLSMLKSRTPKPLYNSTLPNMFCTRPTQDLLERWLREKHGLSVGVYVYNDSTWQWIIEKMGTSNEHSILPDYITGKPGSSETHELSREAALLHALTLLPDNPL